MRSAWEVLRYFELSGKICENVIRLLPLKTAHRLGEARSRVMVKEK